MPSLTGDPADPFVLGHAPFWPVDRLVEPDAWAGHIPFAFWIVDALRPRLLVELGTHSGNSYLAFAQAVHRLGLGTACFAVDTWHGDAHAGYYGEEVFLELSRYHDARYGAFSRLVRSTFDQAAQHFSDASVDLLHVDGYHTCEAVAHDFETWRPKLSARAVVLFHDINVREGDFGVWRLWDELRSGYPHFEFLHGHGLGVLGVGSDPPAAVTTLLRTTPDAAGVGRIREAFARLGSAVVERLHFQARAEALQNEVGRLGEGLRAAGQEVAARDELLRRGADERVGREAEIAEQRRLIEQLGQERAGREAEIAEQRRLIEQLGQERAGREAEIAEQRRLIEQLGQERAGREAEIAEQRRLIEELQHEIVRLGTLRVADRQELTGVGERLHRVERERAEAHDEVETLRAALMALHQSRSIRLTRPLRQAGGWYRSTVAWVRRGVRPP